MQMDAPSLYCAGLMKPWPRTSSRLNMDSTLSSSKRNGYSPSARLPAFTLSSTWIRNSRGLSATRSERQSARRLGSGGRAAPQQPRCPLSSPAVPSAAPPSPQQPRRPLSSPAVPSAALLFPQQLRSRQGRGCAHRGGGRAAALRGGAAARAAGAAAGTRGSAPRPPPSRGAGPGGVRRQREL